MTVDAETCTSQIQVMTQWLSCEREHGHGGSHSARGIYRGLSDETKFVISWQGLDSHKSQGKDKA